MVFIFYLKKKISFDLTFLLNYCSVSLLLSTAKFLRRVVLTISVFFFSTLSLELTPIRLSYPSFSKTALVKITSDLILLNPAVSSQSLSSSWTCLRYLAVGFLSSRNIYSLSFSLDSPLTWLLILFSIICSSFPPILLTYKFWNATGFNSQTSLSKITP